jgi:hypothetical protein
MKCSLLSAAVIAATFAIPLGSASAEFRLGQTIVVAPKPGEVLPDNRTVRYRVVKCANSKTGLCLKAPGVNMEVTANGSSPTVKFFKRENGRLKTIIGIYGSNKDYWNVPDGGVKGRPRTWEVIN